MSKRDGGPAFPESYIGAGVPHSGMTLRQWYAGQALAGMALRHDGDYSENDHERGLPARHAERYAAAAYRIAGAMLAEMDKP